jgi:hypothetical protein
VLSNRDPCEQKSPTEYGGSECDVDALTLNMLRPTRAVEPWEKFKTISPFKRRTLSSFDVKCE